VFSLSLPSSSGRNITGKQVVLEKLIFFLSTNNSNSRKDKIYLNYLI